MVLGELCEISTMPPPQCFNKNHTEEDGAHLRISFWHLFMNLKNKYLLKKLLKRANKKCKNFEDMKCDRQNSLSFWTIFCP